MVASPWKFLVGLTRRHGKDNKSAVIEDTSETPVPKETREPAQLQPPTAPALPGDIAQDAADQVDAVSMVFDDVPSGGKVVEGPAGPDERGLRQVDGLATTKARKRRVFRKKNVPAAIQSAPLAAPVVSNNF